MRRGGAEGALKTTCYDQKMIRQAKGGAHAKQVAMSELLLMAYGTFSLSTKNGARQAKHGLAAAAKLLSFPGQICMPWLVNGEDIGLHMVVQSGTERSIP